MLLACNEGFHGRHSDKSLPVWGTQLSHQPVNLTEAMPSWSTGDETIGQFQFLSSFTQNGRGSTPLPKGKT